VIISCREASVRRAFKDIICTLPAPRSPAQPIRYVFPRLNTLIYSPDKEAGAVFVKIDLARRTRTDKRCVEGVGASVGQPGSSSREGRSLLVNQHVDVKLTQGGKSPTPTAGRTLATEGAARSGGCDPHDQPPEENHVRRVSNDVCTPAASWIRHWRPCPALPLPTFARHTQF
jgi:hypothetical protein